MANQRIMTDTNGRQFMSDSFDRFGDDLSELMLSYLRFDDKITLRCVAKQWNRLVFNKQTAINFNDWIDISDNVRMKTDSDRVKALLKKCPNIRKIYFLFDAITDPVLDVIVANCPTLKLFSLRLKNLSLEAIRRFGQQLGPKLKSIEMVDWSNIPPDEAFGISEQVKQLFNKAKLLITSCPNAESMVIDDSLQLLSRNVPTMTALKKLKIDVLQIDLAHEFLDFVAKFAPNVKCLRIFSRPYDSQFHLRQRPNLLICLEELQLNRLYVADSFYDRICEFAPNLKKLVISNHDECGPLTNAMLVSLAKCQSLTHFSFGFERNLLHSMVSDSGICHLIEKCLRLREIELKIYPTITYKTIDLLIKVAKKRPNDTITFKCYNSKPISDLPKNLRIVFYSN